MKQALSLILALSLAFAFSLPAHSADRPTPRQRMQAVEERYGIPVSCDKAGKPRLAEQLTQLEKALALLGEDFTLRMADRYFSEDFPDEGLRVLITADPEKEALGVVASFSIVDNVVRLYVREKAATPAANIVHEFGHVYHYSLSQEDFDEFFSINGGSNGYYSSTKRPFDPEQYATRFAATRVSEDFAETFRAMVVGGAEKPADLDEDTLLHRKYRWIQESLAWRIGKRSRVAGRAAAFLGVD